MKRTFAKVPYGKATSNRRPIDNFINGRLLGSFSENKSKLANVVRSPRFGVKGECLGFLMNKNDRTSHASMGLMMSKGVMRATIKGRARALDRAM